MSSLKRGTFEKMFEAAKLCRQRALDVPMLVLIYTALDTLAWAIHGHRDREVRRRFVMLCEAFVLPDADLPCTATELYAARCSILHSLGWESDLSVAGKARAIAYSFGTDDPRLAQEALDHQHAGKFIFVKADELLAAAERAATRVAEVARSDQALAARLAAAERKQYRSLETQASDSIFDAYLSKVQRDERT